jgi:23S rRNA (adenine2503-C2)-methyltransferase
MIQKVNDETELAYEMAALLSGLGVYVNLIPYNPVNEVYQRSTPERIKAFAAVLTQLGIENEIRREKGRDINAACGQLRRREPAN